MREETREKIVDSLKGKFEEELKDEKGAPISFSE